MDAARIRKTLVGLMAAVAVTLQLTSAPAIAATSHHTIAEVETYARGKSVGPNSYTQWGKATIVSWSSSYSCTSRKTYYSAGLNVTQQQSPMVATGRAVDGAPSDTTLSTMTSPCPQLAANAWYNPLSWDWGSLMGSAWDNIFKKCLKGAASGVVGTASGTLAVKLLVRGAKLTQSPEGYAAIAIGSCVVGVLF